MSDKIKVVFLGSRPLGKFALEILKSIPFIEVVACVVKKPSANAWWTEDPYYDCSYSYSNHEELLNVDFDLGISINYWKIIPNEIIKKPKLGFINLHHAYNLCLRGRDMNARAILDARKLNRWFHGTCLHYTDDGLDTGPIIANAACEITDYDTGWSLFQKIENKAKELLIEWLPRVAQSKIPCAFPEDDQPLYLKEKNGTEPKFINCLEDCPIDSFDIVRAYDFNNLFEPAFIMKDGKRTYLTTQVKDGHEPALIVDKEKIIYFHRIQDW